MSTCRLVGSWFMAALSHQLARWGQNLGTNWERSCQFEPNAPTILLQGGVGGSANRVTPCNANTMRTRLGRTMDSQLQELVPVREWMFESSLRHFSRYFISLIQSRTN